MLAWEAHEREDKPEMADVLKNLVVPQKLAHKRPRRHKHDSIEPSSRKSQQRGGNKSNIPLKQWKRLQMLTMHMLHSKHFFKCNASLDNSYNFKLLRIKNATKTAQNNNTKATATACNSTLDTLVLRKRESWDNRRGTELPSNPKPVTQSCRSIFT